MTRFHRFLVGALAIASLGSMPTIATALEPTTQPTEPIGAAALRQEAKALAPIVKGDFTKKFLAATAELPSVKTRTAYVDPKARLYVSKSDYEKRTEKDREGLETREFDERIYYYTRYGSPLAYTRVWETLAKHGVRDLTGSRILDYGYGTVGHLRLLASLGIDAVGVDVDPFLTALYSEPSDQGDVKGVSGKDGRVTLVSGQWPADVNTKKAVGDGYDLFISKNTLKNGYIHPSQPVDKRMLVDLGVSDEEYVKALASIVKKGGHVIIYNICPAPNPPDKPYIPWADGKCPFPRSMWEKAGFEVLAFDEDDCKPMREMGLALGWDAGQSREEYEADFFAHYSLFRRR